MRRKYVLRGNIQRNKIHEGTGIKTVLTAYEFKLDDDTTSFSKVPILLDHTVTAY